MTATERSNEEFLREIDELLQDDVSEEPDQGTEKEQEAVVELAAPKTGVAALRAALAAHKDIEVLRGLCEGGRVPEEVRTELWKECLNVSRRPDALGSWSGPLDCENQEAIHSQCTAQAGKLGLERAAQDQAVSSMEQVITFYCKSRNVRYSPDCGWPELLLPLVVLGLSRADLFNCFYAMLVKYIPRDCRPDGRPFHLFRLLLLYHDPELCSFLDTKKLPPDTYLLPWAWEYPAQETIRALIQGEALECEVPSLSCPPHVQLRSLFACTCELEVARVMWDHYLLERDPFLVFFLALVMVVNTKELLLEGSPMSQEELCSTLSSIPSQLSAEDIEDFFSLAQYYASRTPQSFRKDYHSLLFGSGRTVASVATNVSHALCLPISLHEIQEVNHTHSEGAEPSAVNYFIVDCRPVDHFSCGHLPNSYHLDANLLLHSPSDFAVAAERLCSRVKQAGLEGGEHLCFLGSGREQEDQYVLMVVAKFLQKSVPYVSLARGGYLELSSLLGSRIGQVLEDYDAEKCRVFYSEGGQSNSVRSDTSDSDSEASSLYRQKLQAKGARLYTQLASGFRERSQRFKTKMSGFWSTQQKPTERHVSRMDRPSKRYRNVHADVFVIADEDEENETPSASSSEEEPGQAMVNVSLFTTNPEVTHSFPCTEIKDGMEAFPSHLLLTPDSMVVLRELSDRAGWARIKHRQKLQDILKITAKKKHPDIITFKFGTGSGETAVITHQLAFRIPNTHKATTAIKGQISKLHQ